MNTGGPAFPCRETGVDMRDDKGNVIGCRVFPPSQGMTLLDWMAGQALVAIPHIGCGSDLEPEQVAHDAYGHAAAMLAEKARREADHSPDATKMVPDPFAETTLRRLAADVLPADIKDAADEQTLVWCAEQVRARVNTLEAINRELVEALEACEYAFSKFAPQEESAYGMAWIKVRAAIAKAKGVA